jgi:hypothetical protein
MKFSILLPVKDGGEYVKECVDSILSQTLQDFNLISKRCQDCYTSIGQTIINRRELG